MFTIGSIVSLIICAAIVIFLAKVVFKGTKSVIGFLINIAAGALALWVLDLIGLGVNITWFTAGIVGFLGVPGVIVVLILTYVFPIL